LIMAIYRILTLLLATTAAAEEFGPFTKDFVKFMQRNPERNEYMLSAYREYGNDGTFGGRAKDETGEISHHPVVFVHGNSDSALHHSEIATGWTDSVHYFKDHGYNVSSLYGLSYGSRNISDSMHNSITCRNLVGLRRFLEAIIAYTQTEKVDIVAHSMGVSLARKAIQGGMVVSLDQYYSTPPTVTSQVDAFVAIAGANYGMCMCLQDSLKGEAACGQKGFGPGTCGKSEGTSDQCGDEDEECEEDDYASILRQINNGTKEATFLASLWSKDDIVVGKNNLVWGRKTSKVPYSDYTHAYSGFTHFQMKNETTADQFNLVTRHSRHPLRSKRNH
ncbi:hypothetical protein PMAYCL1PPCAC_01945, partial [Pristionchus mayeri]